MYVPLTKKEGYSISPLLKCLEVIKAWMACNFLKLNEGKTEVMVFGGTTGTTSVDLGSLAQYTKPTITNLGIKMDRELKLESD